jgi:hypothetical protein
MMHEHPHIKHNVNGVVAHVAGSFCKVVPVSGKLVTNPKQLCYRLIAVRQLLR